MNICYISGKDTDAVAALNDKKDLIVVVGQDEQGIGVVDPAHYWEEERGVAEIIMNPDCDPGKRRRILIIIYLDCSSFLSPVLCACPSPGPELQYGQAGEAQTSLCELSGVTSVQSGQSVTIIIVIQVDSFQARVLKGNPFLASYGLQPPQQNARAGTYKAPTFIKVD